MAFMVVVLLVSRSTAARMRSGPSGCSPSTVVSSTCWITLPVSARAMWSPSVVAGHWVSASRQ
ncbi:hypothetical protein NKG94_17165 [Micromonospora sp. M12]